MESSAPSVACVLSLLESSAAATVVDEEEDAASALDCVSLMAASTAALEAEAGCAGTDDIVVMCEGEGDVREMRLLSVQQTLLAKGVDLDATSKRKAPGSSGD